jgi:RNA polymerase subunit RPABC4/transcription elongation factor Spt4
MNTDMLAMEPVLKRCRACGKCSEHMDKCPVCKTQFKLKWFDFLLSVSPSISFSVSNSVDQISVR